MMGFKKGQSGNPAGRKKGALSRRAKLAKLLEPFAEELVGKLIELALKGDVNALRLCMERLIPKIQKETFNFNVMNLGGMDLAQLNESIVCSALNGQVSVVSLKH